MTGDSAPRPPPTPAGVWAASPPPLRTPSRAGFQKAPGDPTAFFGPESCRFIASPQGGVYEAELYKYGRLTVLTRLRSQEERTARPLLTGEMSPPLLS